MSRLILSDRTASIPDSLRSDCISRNKFISIFVFSLVPKTTLKILMPCIISPGDDIYALT